MKIPLPLFCLGILLSACRPVPQSAAKWEYKVVELENTCRKAAEKGGFSAKEIESREGIKLLPGTISYDLFEIGREGWELVAAVPLAETEYGSILGEKRQNNRTGMVQLIFKRPAR